MLQDVERPRKLAAAERPAAERGDIYNGGAALSEEALEAFLSAVARARVRGAPVLAVGTTVVRALESAKDPERAGHVRACAGETRLLIQPGYAFGVVDRLLTNFHLPKSSLLMLVAAFAGHELIMRAYREAVRARYRFFSYGDCMLIL